MYKKFFLILSIFFFQFFIATAETNISIAYIDFEFLVKKSLPGLQIKKKINDISTQKKNELSLIKKKLVKEENDLIKQKNILKEEKFNSELLVLKKKIDEFKKKELEHNNFIKTEYNKLNQSLLSKIEPILIAYTDKNNKGYIFYEDDEEENRIYEPITYGTVNLMFEEPENVKKVYAEEHGCFHTLKKLSAHTYEKTSHKGKTSIYKYKDGALVEAEIDAGLISFEIVAR